MPSKDKVTDELRQIYADAAAEGIWIYEIGQFEGRGPFAAGAGWISEVEAIEKREGIEIDLSKISPFAATHLTAPGLGETREEACLNAIATLKATRPKARG